MSRQSRQVQFDWTGNAAAGQFLNTDHMILFLSTFVPTVNSVISDFITNRVAVVDMAAFVMAAAWNVGLDLGGDGQAIYGGLAKMTPTGGATVPILAGGWFLTNQAETSLLGWKTFDNPIAFSTLGDKLFIKPSFTDPLESDSDDEFLAGP